MSNLMVAGFGLLLYTVMVYIFAFLHGYDRGARSERIEQLQKRARKGLGNAEDREDPDWWRKA
jgi:hypothetical protein